MERMDNGGPSSPDDTAEEFNVVEEIVPLATPRKERRCGVRSRFHASTSNEDSSALIDLTKDDNDSDSLTRDLREQGVHRSCPNASGVSGSAVRMKSLDEARMDAVAKSKWLLVCVSKKARDDVEPVERPLFPNGVMENVFSSRLVYLRVHHLEADGGRLVNFFRVRTIPAMFLLDPRQGDVLHRFSGLPFHWEALRVELCDALRTNPCYHIRDQMCGRPTTIFPPPEMCPACRILSRKRGPLESAHHLSPKRGKSGDKDDAGELSDEVIVVNCSDEEDNGELSNKTANRHSDKANTANHSDGANAVSIADVEEWKNLVVGDCEPCTIKFRFPLGDCGKTETAVFSMKTPLSAVFRFIDSRGLDSASHKIIFTYPRREFTLEHSGETLGDLGFSKFEVIHVDLIC